MLENNDIVKVTFNQSLFGEEIKNVFWYLYELAVAGVTLLDLLDLLTTEVFTPMSLTQVPDLEYVNSVAENVTNGIDTDTLPIAGEGTDLSAGPASPSYVSAGYTLNVGNRTTRPGGKRIAGMGETRVVDNAYVPGGTTAADAALAMATSWFVTGTPTGSGIIVPVVVGRAIDGSPDLLRINEITTVSVNPTIRSQVSRRSSV